jgi:hypothetical protein
MTSKFSTSESFELTPVKTGQKSQSYRFAFQKAESAFIFAIKFQRKRGKTYQDMSSTVCIKER